MMTLNKSQLNGTVVSELSWMWKEAIVAYFKELSQYLYGLIETSHKIS
jgi:hypothetical protein